VEKTKPIALTPHCRSSSAGRKRREKTSRARDTWNRKHLFVRRSKTEAPRRKEVQLRTSFRLAATRLLIVGMSMKDTGEVFIKMARKVPPCQGHGWPRTFDLVGPQYGVAAQGDRG